MSLLEFILTQEYWQFEGLYIQSSLFLDDPFFNIWYYTDEKKIMHQ